MGARPNWCMVKQALGMARELYPLQDEADSAKASLS